MDKVLPGNIFILIRFKEKVFTQINFQQMNTFTISSRVDCAIQINFNLQLTKDGSCHIGNDLNPSKSFILGKFYVIRVNVNTMRIYSGVTRPEASCSNGFQYTKNLLTPCYCTLGFHSKFEKLTDMNFFCKIINTATKVSHLPR